MKTGNERKVYTSDIWIDGKRISSMREISKATFGESFLFIQVNEGRFVVSVDDTIDISDYYKFTEKYKLCRVLIRQEISISELMKQRKA